MVAKDGTGEAPTPPATRPIRLVYMLKDFTPRVFEGPGDFLRDNRLAMADRAEDADILIGRRVRDFRRPYLMLDRLNVVWTHEPFFAMDSVPIVTVKGRRIHVFNVYNGNVYTDNFFDLPGKGRIASLARGALNAPFDDKRIVAVMTRKEKAAVIDGRDRSLTAVREKIALDGHAAGGITLYGGGWPEGVAAGESRYVGNRREVKRQILSGSNFNLCLENCNYDHYVTEKLWDAIAARCLPIYFANATILQVPAIDAAILVNRHPTYAAIRDAIENLSEAEFVERLNELIAFADRAIRLRLRDRSRARTQRRLAALLRATA